MMFGFPWAVNTPAGGSCLNPWFEFPTCAPKRPTWKRWRVTEGNEGNKELGRSFVAFVNFC